MPTQTPAMDRNLASAAKKNGNQWLTLVTLCGAVLIAQLDTSVVNLATRPIGDYFKASVGALQWVVDSYNLLYAVLLLTGGLLADLRGRRMIFMAGAAVFTVSSLICALAPTVGVLITGRALAGVGAALLLPASLAIVRVAWPDAKDRARALGIWAGCNGLALGIGPTVGGSLIHAFGWRSIFLVVVPVGLAALVLAPLTITETSDPQNRHFDLKAQVFGAVSLGALALAAIESHDSAITAMAAFLVSVVSFFLFLRTERRRGSGALVPLDMFDSREFRGAITATTGMTFGMYGVIFLLPLVWQSTGRLDPVSAGLALIPMALIFVLVSPCSGSLSSRFGQRLLSAGGVGLIGLGPLTIAATAHSHSLLGAEIGLGLTGLGMGFATGPLMAMAVGSVQANRSGTAAALINVARMAGATIGVAVLGAVYVLAGDGPKGLMLAMIFGGLVQIVAAVWAWFAMARQAGASAN